MANIRIPSLQHLARNWRETPDLIKRDLVNLAKNPPIFSYAALFGVVKDLLILKVPYDQIETGIKRINRKDLRANFLEVLPLLRDHFEGINPDYVLPMNRSHYSAGQGLQIPFDPLLIYGVGGQVYFPWFSFWRSNPLAQKRLSLFITIVEEMLLQDPDLENARFQILDFSKPDPKQPRTLSIVETKDIPRVSDKEKTEMLEIFAAGFFSAQAELAGVTIKKKKDSKQDRPEPPHPDLFDKR